MTAHNPNTSSVPPLTVLTGSTETPAYERSIGAILVDAGRLTPAAVEQIACEQKAKNLRFGEAAIRLGLLRQEDVDFALSRQFGYWYLQPDSDAISSEVVAAFRPFNPLVEQMRALRSQLGVRWFNAGSVRRALAVTSAEPNEGRSFITANLAVLFSQLGDRTLLIDADLRRPRQHHLFKLRNEVGLSTVLSGRSGREAVVRVDGLTGLAVLPAGPLPPNPQELLGRVRFSQLLDAAVADYDVVLVDTPAATVYADTQLIASRAGGAILVARNNRTSTPALQMLSTMLRDSSVVSVGTVLNDF